MDRNGVLLRIKRLLPFHRLPQFFVSFRERNGTNPSHVRLLVSAQDCRHSPCESGISTPYTLTPAVANTSDSCRTRNQPRLLVRFPCWHGMRKQTCHCDAGYSAECQRSILFGALEFRPELYSFPLSF